MKRLHRPAGLLLALIVICPALAPGLASASPAGRGSGHVYTATNAATGNSLLAFHRDRHGTLVAAGSYTTGGTGTGTALGSGHSVVASANGRLVLVVNAGSNSVSAFARLFGSLHRIGSAVGSDGATPTSVTIHDHLVYVMNARSGSIAGFRLSLRRGLVSIRGSTQPLSAAGVDTDSQIQFDRNGRVLIVDQRGTANVLQTFVIGRHGAAEPPQTIPSAGGGPFGFDVDERGHILLSNVSIGDSSGASSYDVSRQGVLTENGSPVASGESAACWLAAVGRYAYTTNAGSGSIGTFQVAGDGALSFTSTTPIAPDAKPLDEVGIPSGRLLYVLASGLNEILGYRVGRGGTLTQVTSVVVPAGALGLGGS